MTPIFAKSTNELVGIRVDLLIRRMSLNTTKEEWDKLAKKSDEIEAELKRREVL